MAAIASTATERPSNANFVSSLMDHCRDGIVFVDLDCKVLEWNDAIANMTGFDANRAIGQTLRPSTLNLADGKGNEVAQADCPFANSISNQKTRKGEYRIIGRSGREVKADISSVPVYDNAGKICGALILVQDTSVQLDLQRQLKDLYAMSMLDPLTQVANRSEFERALNEFVRAHESSDFECSLIICDIDFFKQINDNYGHNVGDQALVAFAQFLKQFVRSQDMVARYGGEEFVILCANCDMHAAVERAEEIRVSLTKTPQSILNGKCITASFGVSQLKDGDSPTDFFVRADQALLNAKESGRNKVVSALYCEGSNPTLEDATISSLAGVKWRKETGNILLAEEFKTTTPKTVLVESLRGYLHETDAEIKKAEEDYLTLKLSTSSRNLKGNFIVDVEIVEADDEEITNDDSRARSYIKISIKGVRSGWFSAKADDLAPDVMRDLRRYLMIAEESNRIQAVPAATKPGKR